MSALDLCTEGWDEEAVGYCRSSFLRKVGWISDGCWFICSLSVCVHSSKAQEAKNMNRSRIYDGGNDQDVRIELL